MLAWYFLGSKAKGEVSFKMSLSFPSLERKLVDSFQVGGAGEEVRELEIVPTQKLNSYHDCTNSTNRFLQFLMEMHIEVSLT